MSNPNQVTIETYNQEASTYIAETPSTYQGHHSHLLAWMNAAVSGIEVGGKILEIGSATPRDAIYMQSKGYEVQVSDASAAFVKNLKHTNPNAILFNVLTDPIPGDYALILANAVAPHFTEQDVKIFIQKISLALTPGQRLAFNLKEGDGSDWVNEKSMHKRYIHYWHVDDVKDLLKQYDFKVIFFEQSVVGDLPNHKWINIVLEKI